MKVVCINDDEEDVGKSASIDKYLILEDFYLKLEYLNQNHTYVKFRLK